MNKQRRRLLTVIACAACIGLGTLVANGAGLLSAQAGDASDPLVTKSYVDQLVAKLNGGNGETSNGGSTGGSTASNQLEIVTLKPGEQLIAKGGAELVVRAGKSAIYSADASGVSDLTDGKDLVNGEDAPSNHLLLVPRDGRGLVAKDTPKNSVTIMVRGGYTIEAIEPSK